MEDHHRKLTAQKKDLSLRIKNKKQRDARLIAKVSTLDLLGSAIRARHAQLDDAMLEAAKELSSEQLVRVAALKARGRG